MTNLTKSLFAAAVVATAAVQAQAQVPVGDLVLNFRQQAGTTYGANNLSVDIGTFATYAGKQNVTVGQFDLSSIGAGLDNIQFSVVGANVATGPGAKGVLWMSEARGAGSSVDPTVQGTEAAWLNTTASTMKTTSGKISPIALGLVSDSDAKSYHTFIGDNGQFGTAFQGNVETSTGVGFGASSSVVADLFYLQSASGNGTPSSYVGNFTLMGDGTVVYNAAVPEPTTFGILAGAGLLLVSARRQLRKQA